MRVEVVAVLVTAAAAVAAAVSYVVMRAPAPSSDESPEEDHPDVDPTPPICSHCGKQGGALKLCSRCKQASYCGAECQKAGWNYHKTTCAKPIPLAAALLTDPLQEIFDSVTAADAAGDWRGVLKWEGRMAEMMADEPDGSHQLTLFVFQKAHQLGLIATGHADHAEQCARLELRRAEVLGKMEHFREQGIAICSAAENLLCVQREKPTEAKKLFQRARDLGAAHGFFSVECKACEGLGRVAVREGRHEEGVTMLRHALAAAPLNEDANPHFELRVLQMFIEALIFTSGIAEAEPLVVRYRELATAESRAEGVICHQELDCHLVTARIHEARGRPQESAREAGALFDLLRANEAAVQGMRGHCREMLIEAAFKLSVLNVETGDPELVRSLMEELAKVPRG